MNRFFAALVFSFALFCSGPAQADPATHFRGVYTVIGTEARSRDPQQMVCDVDTIGNLWARWASGPLPPDDVQYKDSPGILVGFTFRDTTFFTLEANAMVSQTALIVPGENTDRLELALRPDGNYDLGVLENGVATKYELSSPQPLQ